MLQNEHQPKNEYVIKIIPQNSETFTQKNNSQHNRKSFDNSNTTSQDSTAIDNNSKEQSIITSNITTQSNLFIKNFILSKTKIFEIPFNLLNDDSDILSNNETIEHNDPFYNESLLSIAFDSEIN